MYKFKAYLVVFVLIATTLKMNSQNKSDNSLSEFLINQGYYPIVLNKNAASHLIVKVKINSVEGNFILDTGASATVVHSLREDYFKLKIDENSVSNEGAGAGGNNITIVTSKSNMIELSDYKIENFNIVLMNLDHVNLALKQLGDEQEIDGVIGADILKTYQGVIDYSNLTLYLKIIEND